MLTLLLNEGINLIDSAEKRRTAAHVSPVGGPGVTPNATKDAEWRAQVGRAYMAGGAATGPPGLAIGRTKGLATSLISNLAG